MSAEFHRGITTTLDPDPLGEGEFMEAYCGAAGYDEKFVSREIGPGDVPLMTIFGTWPGSKTCTSWTGSQTCTRWPFFLEMPVGYYLFYTFFRDQLDMTMFLDRLRKVAPQYRNLAQDKYEIAEGVASSSFGFSKKSKQIQRNKLQAAETLNTGSVRTGKTAKWSKCIL
jgi:hypothetical protein